MNISNYIDQWSKKIIKESIDEGKYDHSMENPDDFKSDDMDKNADEYEKWMKDREKVMKDLEPKSVKEGCCDEDDKELSSVTEPTSDNHEEDNTDCDDCLSADESCPVFETQLNEGAFTDFVKNSLSKMKDYVKSFQSDTWQNVVKQAKESGKTGVSNFSKAITGLLDRNEHAEIWVSSKVGGVEGTSAATMASITDFKGLKLLCVARATNKSEKAMTLDDLASVLKENKIEKMTNQISAIVYLSKKDQSDSSEDKGGDGIVITEVTQDGKRITLKATGVSTNDKIADLDKKSLFS